MEAIRGAIGWLSLPFDIQTLWNFFWRWIAPALPGLVSIVLGYLYHAPYWQIALLAGSFFALFYLGMFGIVALRRRALSSALTDAPTRSVRTARAVSTQDEAVPELKADERGKRIEKWRAEIRAHAFDRYPLGTSRFADTETYLEMRPYLSPKIRERFESQVGAALTFVGPEHLRGSEGDRRVLFGEVARIEHERVFDAPQPITNQAAPGQLKALCFHLADELDDEHRSYLNSEEMVMLWEQELKEQGVSESEIDQRIARARDEHLIETLNKYNKDIKGRLLKLHDALGPQGWFGAVDRFRFENLSDPYYMSNLAKRLREVGGKLPDS